MGRKWCPEENFQNHPLLNINYFNMEKQTKTLIASINVILIYYLIKMTVQAYEIRVYTPPDIAIGIWQLLDKIPIHAISLRDYVAAVFRF
ncbi:hypothetical protein [Bacillus sp. FJAT-28004]|uniref:hypothetical protein n=1 Tax=Bacillus sp. FJAT-28004 TaxID=1679165 RepID=UPI0006B6186A|nr:hypothetical protein [Bacillus sp. FJAT-28004]